MKMPFGRHQGVPLNLLPDPYLQWLMTIDLREPLASAVAAEWAALRNPAHPDLILARHVIDAGFRVLAKTHHPDAGGDVKAMQKLNSTVTRLRRQLEEVLA